MKAIRFFICLSAFFRRFQNSSIRVQILVVKNYRVGQKLTWIYGIKEVSPRVHPHFCQTSIITIYYLRSAPRKRIRSGFAKHMSDTWASDYLQTATTHPNLQHPCSITQKAGGNWKKQKKKRTLFQPLLDPFSNIILLMNEGFWLVLMWFRTWTRDVLMGSTSNLATSEHLFSSFISML